MHVITPLKTPFPSPRFGNQPQKPINPYEPPAPVNEPNPSDDERQADLIYKMVTGLFWSMSALSFGSWALAAYNRLQEHPTEILNACMENTGVLIPGTITATGACMMHYLNHKFLKGRKPD